MLLSFVGVWGPVVCLTEPFEVAMSWGFVGVAVLVLLCERLIVESTTFISGPRVTSPLVLPLSGLTEILTGSGKAKLFWSDVRRGVDPLGTASGEERQLSERAQQRVRDYLCVDGSSPQQQLFPTTVTQETLSKCGTRKLLQSLPDGQSIESVLIPSYKHDRTTLCVSTQVGCDRGCAFCLTGKMGLLRNLTSEEILSQVFRGLQVSLREKMPPMTNVVFMGMGDAGRNLDAVGTAVNAMVDRDCFRMASSKITVSTVGPSPEVFLEVAKMPVVIAWSLHSPDDSLRRMLVPSTRHSTAELRAGLLAGLASRPNVRSRTIMIAFTLIAGINDSEGDAQLVADFVKPMLAVAPKIAIDLIPYNDISVQGFTRPDVQRVNAFQRVLRENGLFCSVRVTRGDDESSACGMLATASRRGTVRVSRGLNI